MKEKMIELPINEVKGLMTLFSIFRNSYEFKDIENAIQVSNYLSNLNQRIQKEEEN
jgi:hypothetical protein